MADELVKIYTTDERKKSLPERVKKAAFFDELEKIAFDWRAIKRVGRLAKQRQIRVHPESSFGVRGLAAMPRKDVASSMATIKQLSSRGLVPPEQLPHVGKLLRDGTGKVVVPRRGGAIGAISGLDKGVDKSIKGLTPRGRRALESTLKGHELAELASKRSGRHFKAAFGHVTPQPILKEHNMVTTLPRGTRRAGGVHRKLRKLSGEDVILEQATRGVSGKGMTFGKGPRLSRHARKRVSQRMEELTSEGLHSGSVPHRLPVAGINL